MAIFKDIQQFLENGQPRSTSEILARLPTISSLPEGEAILRLLLRLNRDLKPLRNDRWILSRVKPTAERRIVAETQAYFVEHNRRGDFIERVAEHVTANTGYSETQVRATILGRFKHNAGRMIYNYLKDQGE